MMKNVRIFLGFLALLCLLPVFSFAQIAGQNPKLFTHKNNGYTLGVGMNAVETGDYTGQLNFRGWVDDQYYHSGIEIASQVTGPVQNDGFEANLSFSTGYPILQTRILITADGLVGVGTETPEYELDIIGDTRTSEDFFGRLHVDNNDSEDAAPDTYIDEAYFEYHTVGGFGANAPETDQSSGALLTIAPGNGAADHQLFFTEDGFFHRFEAQDATSWGNPWLRFLSTGDIAGTENQIAKFTGPNQLGDSRIFDDGAQIGLGTSSPDGAYDIEIEGSTLVDGDMTVSEQFTAEQNAYVAGVLNVGTTEMPGSFGPIATNTYHLFVAGGILTEEVLVRTGWADYVFEEDYPLLPLEEVEAHIQEKGHLPNTPSAQQVEEEGLKLAGSTVNQQEKIEELFLYVIELNKEVKALKEKSEALETELKELKAKQ